MSDNLLSTHELFGQLRPGDRIAVEHLVTVGSRQWTSRTEGTVDRTDRIRHGLHFRRNADDRVWSDIIFITRADGEKTAVTLDEFTTIQRMD